MQKDSIRHKSQYVLCMTSLPVQLFTTQTHIAALKTPRADTSKTLATNIEHALHTPNK